ncbi:hypothetical protein ACFFUB_07755 [Algimonas porphyrae]|uniref:DUF3052 domain-containing protein n=1 Tax=Algimonas porphyrae TaxID=1128113 RepID=A0ABQ5V2W4_9PROT|nr:DUF3052 domain-containing protein [Algimonas porphyrae]GLQ20931.1 hypothetical protein GCM10007854_18860 [Algimonas porphyrae]
MTDKMCSRNDGRSQSYSGTPLFRKLGLKPGLTCLSIGAPPHYRDLVEGAEDVAFRVRARQADIVHLFCPDRKTLNRKIHAALDKVGPGGSLWVSWPKKSSPLHKDLTEGDLRTVILPTGWVDVKVCAVDADWSALKFMRRKVPES